MPKQKPSKALEGLIKGYFSRPSLRRLKYILTGVHGIADLYVLGNIRDSKFEFNDPEKTIGLVQVKDDETKNTIKEFFDFFQIPKNAVGLIAIDNIIQIANKVKWDLESLQIVKEKDGSIIAKGIIIEQVKEEKDEDQPEEEVETDIDGNVIKKEEIVEQQVPKAYVFHPAASYFSMVKLAEIAQSYIKKIVTENTNFLTIPYVSEERASQYTLTGELISESKLLSYPCQDTKVFLFLGQDILSHKHLIEKDSEEKPDVGIKIWAESLGSLNYGGYFSDKKVTMHLIRDNVLLFPKRKEK